MNLQLVRTYGVLVGGLAVLGLFTKDHLFGLMNVDPALDMVRVVLAAYLLYVGFVSEAGDMIRTALLATGILYAGMGVGGLFSPTLGGILPSGLTGFDIAFHLITGGLALYAGMHRSMAAHA